MASQKGSAKQTKGRRLEFFFNECHKAKSKAIPKANHCKENIIMSQREIEVKTNKLLEARENAGDQVEIGCRF